MGAEETENLEYFKEFNVETVPLYMDIFKICKVVFNHFYHYSFSCKCKEFGIIPNGLRLKHEPSISSGGEPFFQQWRVTITNAETSLLSLLINEQQRLFLQTQLKFWNLLCESMSLCQERKSEIFINWWFKLYLYQEKFSRKLKNRKLKKIRKLSGEPDTFFFNEKCGFSEDIDFFTGSLPEDTGIICDLLTLNNSNDDEGVSNSSVKIEQGMGVGITPIPSQELDCDTGVNNACTSTEGRYTGKFVSPNVVNLSSKHLSEAEIKLLSKGLNFVPTPREVNISELKADLESFGRILRLKWHFRASNNEDTYNPFKRKSTFNPFKNDAAIEIYLSMVEKEIMNIAKNNCPENFDNLTRGKGKHFATLYQIRVLS